MTEKDLLNKHFKNAGFDIYESMECNVTKAELSAYTDGGVNVCFTLIPYTLESFAKYINTFSIDNEIDSRRKNIFYKDKFTIEESLEDFKIYKSELESLLNEMTHTIKVFKSSKETQLTYQKNIQEIGLNLVCCPKCSSTIIVKKEFEYIKCHVCDTFAEQSNFADLNY